jgi:DNA invertase Pin-like site-specific DNA recombinase
MLQMMGSFAQFERSMILKRQAEGIAAAKAGPDAKGKYAGRAPSIDRDVVSNMIKSGSSLTAIARSLGVSRQSVHRIKAELGL